MNGLRGKTNKEYEFSSFATSALADKCGNRTRKIDFGHCKNYDSWDRDPIN